MEPVLRTRGWLDPKLWLEDAQNHQRIPERFQMLNFPDYSEEWALFVLKNRNKNVEQPSHDYDIVYGPIADDGVAYQLRRYEGGVISLPRLVEELKYAKGITFQYFFGTERALQFLKKL